MSDGYELDDTELPPPAASPLWGDPVPFPEKAWPLFRKALEHIAAHPDEFYMPDWVVVITDPVDRKMVSRVTGLPAPQCGTAACLAGHICLAAGMKPNEVDGSAALDALDLDWDEDEAVRVRLMDVFEQSNIRRYAELTFALRERFTFPEPLPNLDD